MEIFAGAAEQVSLFCRLNINAKREIPIRSSEMGMLIYICKADGEKTPMDIAHFFKVTKAMATNMVTAMNRKGYVEKQQSLDDRRRYIIVPTAKAKELVDSTYKEYYKAMWMLKEKMGEADFFKLISLLETANNILLEEKECERG